MTGRIIITGISDAEKAAKEILEHIQASLLCSDPSNARLRVCGCCHRRWRVSLP